jgi:hypothetical protein
MKRFYTLFILLVLFSATSCKKTWECECKVGNAVVSVIEIHDLGKMGAKNTCQSYETQNNAQGAHETCSLK